MPTLRCPPSPPFGLWVSSAEQKALGLAASGSMLAGFDGVVGIVSNEELAAGGYTADWTSAAPANSSQFYMLGTIEHETSEVMGRTSVDGTDQIGSVPGYTIMDLFRYSSPGVPNLTPGISGSGSTAYFSIDDGVTNLGTWNNDPSNGDLGDWYGSNIPNGGDDAFDDYAPSGVVNALSATDNTLMDVLGWDIPTVQSIQSDYLAITRTALTSDQATVIINGIDALTQTEAQYVNTLLSQVADTTIPAVVVEASMYGVTGTSSEITSLTANFLPAQVQNAIINGYNPQVYACEALGLVFAFGNESGSTAFANNYGPSNAAMPSSAAGDAAFAAAAASLIFGSAETSNTVPAIEQWVSNWKAFYTANGIAGVSSNPTAQQIDLAARGAAWGDAIGLAMADNLGPSPAQTTNFLEDAAEGTAVYGAPLSSQPTPAAFQGSGSVSGGTESDNVQLIGIASSGEHTV